MFVVCKRLKRRLESFQDEGRSLRADARKTRDEMLSHFFLRAVAADRIVDEGSVALRLRADFHHLRHEVDFVVAREEHRSSSPHREAGEDSENVVGCVPHIFVAPQLPGHSVDDDESLLVGVGKLVSLIEELSRLQRTEEVTR